MSGCPALNRSLYLCSYQPIPARVHTGSRLGVSWNRAFSLPEEGSAEHRGSNSSKSSIAPKGGPDAKSQAFRRLGVNCQDIELDDKSQVQPSALLIVLPQAIRCRHIYRTSISRDDELPFERSQYSDAAQSSVQPATSTHSAKNCLKINSMAADMNFRSGEPEDMPKAIQNAMRDKDGSHPIATGLNSRSAPMTPAFSPRGVLVVPVLPSVGILP